MSSFTPHTQAEIDSMLTFLGLDSFDQLYASIPDAVALRRDLQLPKALSEFEVIDVMADYAAMNHPSNRDLVCFAGGGSYDHDIASVTSSIGSRSEFVTAYTPYQPEVAQGVLQGLFEFQSMVSRISGLGISNASLYDGASALVEAINLGCVKTKRSRVVISGGINPNWREVAETFAKGPGHEIEIAPIGPDGATIWPTNLDGVALLVVGYPNFLGFVEDLEAVRGLASSAGALMVVAYDPIAISLLRSPGSYGADIAIAEGQPLGIPLSFGGPYLGLFSVSNELVRFLPGRLVGETLDMNGKRAYVTTLRAREQDIRREKASSNVCTNQTLMAIWAAIQLTWLGKSGFLDVGRSCLSSRVYLERRLVSEGLTTIETRLPSFREFPVRLKKRASTVIDEMHPLGFLAGVALEGSLAIDNFEGDLLIALTEKRTRTEIDRYVGALVEVIR
ncbi:aminomethyl-transferring glycine dehydrogenase subunit GcvPA [Acidithrix sp. C25]|uniref:aminomethyl-transferring glycine dehydrogenase subunit GcvPA n=1 Tax=Acidithrix sp. C25 TaxID=1671482 RepID=UPI00191B96E8|nr:aminomethyl-transferring glycine dehydrogenase subunit GcvPA [Acidithrix sp. C25]CAG4913544.1 unnamed protein product [Acidithrix sp. C25]